MRRLLTFTRKLCRVTPEFQEALEARMKRIGLEKGDMASIPNDAWMFVEEGLLTLLAKMSDGQLGCWGFLSEGSAVLFSGGPDKKGGEGEIEIKAAERSILYYLPKGDEARLDRENIGFMNARVYMLVRTDFRLKEMAALMAIEDRIERVEVVARTFPGFLRAPIEDLVDWLELEGVEREVLEYYVLKFNAKQIALRAATYEN